LDGNGEPKSNGQTKNITSEIIVIWIALDITLTIRGIDIGIFPSLYAFIMSDPYISLIGVVCPNEVPITTANTIIAEINVSSIPGIIEVKTKPITMKNTKGMM